jgi:hypothetical protein
MNAFLIVVGVNAAMVGFGLIFGGYLTRMAPSEEEDEEMHGDYREAREKSWMHALWFSFNYAARARVSWLRIAVTHWPRRPEARRLIYYGAICLIIAAAVGFRFELFNS